jgi:hypothetical protein
MSIFENTITLTYNIGDDDKQLLITMKEWGKNERKIIRIN